MNCNYCNKMFTNKSNLKAHQKSAKYCIKIQKEQENIEKEKNTDIQEIKLLLIEKEAEIKNYINTIYLKDKIIEEKDKLIEKLMTMIQPVNNTVNNQPTTSNTQKINNIINNLTPITDEHMHEQSKYLNIDYIKKGVTGYVDYALEYPFKDKILCVDFARKKIKYKNDDGDIIDDPEMVKLSQKFFKAIENINSEIIGTYVIELKNELDKLNYSTNNDMDEDESKVFGINSDDILDKTFMVMKYRKEVKEAASGNKPDLYYDFVKNICSKITVNK